MALVRGDDDGLCDRCGEIDADVLDVTLLELVTEVLSVAIAESDALRLTKDVVVATSEGDTVAKIEKEPAADDDTLADADVLDVVLLELVTEALSVDIAESDAETFAEDEIAADDDTLADADILDVDDELEQLIA